MNNQSLDTSTLGTLFGDFIGLINNVLVPLVFALAFILFLFGVFKYFFANGEKADEGRKQGRAFILWAVIAFAVMVSVWGLVNILVRTFGFEDETRPCLPTFSGDCNRGSGTGAGTSNPFDSGDALNTDGAANDSGVFTPDGDNIY